MNKKEFIKELHNLYLVDVQTWMKERFEEKGIKVEAQSEAQEKAMLRSILKHNNMDYDYLEWAAEGIEEQGLTLENQFQCLSDMQEYCGSGVLSGRWDCNNDEEDDEIFNCYKKYFQNAKGQLVKNAMHPETA